jgi:hypothetical protein
MNSKEYLSLCGIKNVLDMAEARIRGMDTDKDPDNVWDGANIILENLRKAVKVHRKVCHDAYKQLIK